jgi:hypothetical protein
VSGEPNLRETRYILYSYLGALVGGVELDVGGRRRKSTFTYPSNPKGFWIPKMEKLLKKMGWKGRGTRARSMGESVVFGVVGRGRCHLYGR